MTILIVDDQPNVVSALKAGICWENLGITQIFTALSAFHAREIIQAHPIDILMSDIEMPVESGLSLLRWCRQNHYDFACIFLTSHADFFYVQEALQLGSTDYVLQPVRYEDVEKLLEKTIGEIKTRQEEQTYSSWGKAVYSQKSAFLKSMLHEWFEGAEINVAEKLDVLREMGIPLTLHTQFFFQNADPFLDIGATSLFQVAFHSRGANQQIFPEPLLGYPLLLPRQAFLSCLALQR